MKKQASAASLIRATGLRATTQRIALLDVLNRSRRPRSAEQLVRELKGELNLTTVYRGLEQLGEASLVRRISLGGNHALFEIADAHHHHLICHSCGTIEDIAACVATPELERTLKRTYGFSEIHDHSLEFFGTCKKCT